jgi:hypothetical protein
LSYSNIAGVVDTGDKLLTSVVVSGKTYCPVGYEFGAKPNLITWVVEIF